MARCTILAALLLSAMCLTSATPLLSATTVAGAAANAGKTVIGSGISAAASVASRTSATIRGGASASAGAALGAAVDASVKARNAVGAVVNATVGANSVAANALAVSGKIQAELANAVKAMVDANFQVFPTLLCATLNLGASLYPLSNFTILAPRNSALNLSSLATLSLSDLRVLLASHVVIGTYPLHSLLSLPTGTVLPTLSGHGLLVKVLSGGRVSFTSESVPAGTAGVVAAVIKANVGASLAPVMLGVDSVINVLLGSNSGGM